MRNILTQLATFAIGLVTLAAGPATSPATHPSTQPGAADVAGLRMLARRDVRVHDPSTIVRAGDRYYLFATGPGIVAFSSPDLRNWTGLPRIFERPLTWFADVAPGNRGYLWAPDVVRVDDEHGERWLLYYSVSTFGKNASAIGLAINRTLDPMSPNYKWFDAGVVVRSTKADDFNAIDPSVTRAADGRLWMAFGSFWSGIQLMELDAATGLRKSAEVPLIRLAHKDQIEAACLAQHAGRYYLFVNWGTCCQGVKSTYEIRVGRSDRVEGPYVDRDGKPLPEGGGTRVLATEGTMIGPGHAGIVRDPAGDEQLSFHFYDAADDGKPKLGLRRLRWDGDGWPVVGEGAER